MGTPLYMSPEQATADEAIDARADQYSLGAVLYEMLAGEPPFTGPTNQSVISKSLSAPRPHVSRKRPDAPQELENVVIRTLAIEPAQRYPDMRAFGAALRATGAAPSRKAKRRFYAAGAAALVAAGVLGGWLATRSSGSPVAPAAESLAVLPFRTSGPGVAFLGEGMVDLLSTNLSGVGGIYAVDPRTVLQRWHRSSSRGSEDITRALAVGRALDAGSVVLGSVVSAGGRVRLAADLYSTEGKPLGRAQVDASADSVLGAVDRLSLALLRDVWRSKEPIPNLRLASLTTDSITALRSYLEGERHYRRLAWDSALAAYSQAVESDSTFALAHLRRAQALGWTGGYGSAESREAVAAAARFARRLPPRDRRLLAGYQLFDRGKPASIDSFKAFVATYPDDVEGWYMLGESMFHTHGFQPMPPESISAVFDSVLRRDSTLFPALIHPMELAVLYRDTAQFGRYYPAISRSAPAGLVTALDITRHLVWGPEPSDQELRTALRNQPSWVIQAGFSSYHRPEATSDTVGKLFTRVHRLGSGNPNFAARGFAVRAQVLAGTGRWREARVLLDSLRRLNQEEMEGIEAWSIVLGLTPESFRGRLDTLVKKMPAGPEAEFGAGLLLLLKGRLAEGRRQLTRALASSDSIPESIRGLMIASDGLGAVLQGDSTGGLRRMREGMDVTAAPGMAHESSFLRFQMALVLAARPESRAEGIRWLQYGFETMPLFQPLALLALARAYESAGQRDFAAVAYGRFLRLWDKADPELQGRAREAASGLQEVTAERPTPGSPDP
jgi:TolB-like protein